MSPYVLALLSNLSFSSASLGFEHYSRKTGVVYVNLYKTLVSTALFAFFLILLGSHEIPSTIHILALVGSGVLGLAIGDLFLLQAYTEIGTARTLMVFGLQPFLMATADALLFDQPLKSYQFLAVLILVSSLFVTAHESLRKEGHWQLRGFFTAFCCVCCDGLGVIVTRYVFSVESSLTAMGANFYRNIGAVFFLVLLYRISRKKTSMSFADHRLLTFFSFLGTFLALVFYLEAVRTGSLALISAIAVTGPVFAATIQCVRKKEAPSLHLVIGFFLFALGFLTLTLGGG